MAALTSQRFKWVWLALFLVPPFILPPGLPMRIAILCALYASLGMSYNLILGYTGVASLGHAAFMGVGAYTTALLSTKLGWSPWFGIALGGLLAGVFSYGIGKLTLHLQGVYMVLASWGFVEIVYAFLNNAYAITGGSNGVRSIPPLKLWGLSLRSDTASYYLFVVFALVTFFLLNRWINSRLGRAWYAIRENAVVAGMMGIEVPFYRLMSFCIGSIIAGVGGGLYAHYERYISPRSFTVWESILILSIVMVGGRGNLGGSVVGALLLVSLPEALRGIGEYRMVIYGVLLLLTVLFRPQGIWPPPSPKAADPVIEPQTAREGVAG